MSGFTRPAEQDQSPLRQVTEATLAGALIGSMFGAIGSYLRSPTIIGTNRAPVWRDVSSHLVSSTKWWAGTFFAYTFTKQFSNQVRGGRVPDATDAFIAGATTGAIYSMRSGIALKSMVTLGLAAGTGTFLFEGPWKYLSPLHKRAEFQKENDLEMTLRYKQKIADDKAEVEQRLITLEKKAIEQIQ